MTDILLNVPEEKIEGIMTIAMRCYLLTSMPKQPVPFRCFIYQEKAGGVIAEFTCDGIEYELTDKLTAEWLSDTLMSVCDAVKMSKGCHIMYKWRIRSLIQYEKPKPLSRFWQDKPPEEWCVLPDL